ncbi:hypothetical protein GCM10011571_21760 [Marinithermofilum abyssi]|uniref:YugN-like family protein n=1 Tax=Marinithermofilum abyssi TaxID=1571185 RepID=A0A8J2YDR6_9BACL|nr:YugN family protein [Marinithermofilum abyssi]GGE19474.1 hypothetical protein GCM10011571_21760 [Marinithermofilum abyssi]
MVLEDAGIKGIQKEFGSLEKEMKRLGFVRWAWDYDKASFDMKFEGKESDYYLRIQAHVIQGKLENPKAVVEMDHPVFLRHIFPHGLDPDTEIPEEFKKTVDEVLGKVKETIA